MSTVAGHPPNPGTRFRRGWHGPSSLGGRVSVAVLALLAVVLVALFAGVDLVLRARLIADARSRLADRAVLARRLGNTLPDQQLVNRLRGGGVAAGICDTGGADCPALGIRAGGRGPFGPFGRPALPGDPGAPSAAPVRIQSSGTTLSTRTPLSGGRVLTLSLDTTEITTTVRRLVLLEVVGGLLALLVAGLVLRWISAIALRPLDDMTRLARQITAGDRGRRLGAGDQRSELGRTATAFDDMLDELETAASRAEAAERRMRDFLGDASHELRTPLTGIAANAENLLRDPGDRDAGEAAALAVVRETRRASRLVEALLDVARLDRGPELELAEVDLAQLARQEMERTRALAPGLRVRLVAEGATTVRADPLRIGQVVANLLDNARHATGPDGAVELTVAASPGLVTVTVADDGPGIAPADRERVFERFTRLDASRSRRTGGAGLGLAISRAIVLAHGGRLVAEGRPDGAGGALVRMELPAGPAPSPDPPVSAQQLSAERASAQRAERGRNRLGARVDDPT